MLGKPIVEDEPRSAEFGSLMAEVRETPKSWIVASVHSPCLCRLERQCCDAWAVDLVAKSVSQELAVGLEEVGE